MMPNALTRHVGLNAGTWVLETLLKHYFENLFKDKAARAAATEPTPTNVPGSGELKKDELLYDEAFNIIKVCYTGSYELCVLYVLTMIIVKSHS